MFAYSKWYNAILFLVSSKPAFWKEVLDITLLDQNEWRVDKLACDGESLSDNCYVYFEDLNVTSQTALKS